MNEKKRIDKWTITPEVPSMELNSKRYELCFENEKNNESFEIGQRLIITYVNRHNHTIGCVIEDE